MRNPLRVIAVLAGLIAAFLLGCTNPVGAAPPVAAIPIVSDNCKTVVTQLTNRPDVGNHGIWAIDTITRTVRVCQIIDLEAAQPDLAAAQIIVPVEAWVYHARVSDVGTFTTKGGPALSPNAGDPLVAGMPGKIVGGFTALFAAPADWLGFDPIPLHDATVDGDPKASSTDGNPTTPDWVKALWKAGFLGRSINNDWQWKYTACNGQTWLENARNNGKGATAGDITGTPACASPSPSPSTSMPPPPPPASGGELPVTGSRTTWIASGGAVAAALGVILVVALRRRRVKFVAS